MNKKKEDSIILSVHVCNVPYAEEVMSGAASNYKGYLINIPKNLIPNDLLQIIDKNNHYSYISQIALVKD